MAISADWKKNKTQIYAIHAKHLNRMVESKRTEKTHCVNTNRIIPV